MEAKDITVKAADVQAFVNAKWILAKCECCGEARWKVIPDEAGHILGTWVQTAEGHYTLDGEIRNFAHIFCANCGNTKLITLGLIKDWLAKGGAQ